MGSTISKDFIPPPLTLRDCLNHDGTVNSSHYYYYSNCSYNLTVSHTKQILCSTTGHPSTWNNKTLVLFNPLLSSIHDGELYIEYEFSLFEYDSNGEIVEITYKGVWFMVDNDYLNWSSTVPPVKDASTYATIRFSEWLESMQNIVCD